MIKNPGNTSESKRKPSNKIAGLRVPPVMRTSRGLGEQATFIYEGGD
jgi:hypothetical protein